MSAHEHHYEIRIEWTGAREAGTATYASYGRDHVISDPEGRRPDIPGSADTTFRGDADRWNPEQLLLASASACHQLAYLHLCAVNKVVVKAYSDHAEGWMSTDATGNGRFTRIMLRPKVTIGAGSDAVMAMELHHQAHEACFIANSLNFPVEATPSIEIE